MSEYPWYEQISAADPPLQGDLIDSCPVLMFSDSPRLDDFDAQAQLVQILRFGTVTHVQELRGSIKWVHSCHRI